MPGTGYDWRKLESGDSDVRRLLRNALRRHRKRPQFRGSGLILPRSFLKVEDFPEDALRRLGYRSSMVAVPESGQTRLTTLRHPYKNVHLHAHGPLWSMHEDVWPSFSMSLLRKKWEGSKQPLRDIVRTQGQVADSAAHIMLEGLPGYLRWFSGKLRGSPDLVESAFAEKGSLKISPMKALAILSFVSGTSTLVGGGNIGGAVTGGLSGFLAGNMLGEHLSKVPTELENTNLDENHEDEAFPEQEQINQWKRIGLGAGLPLATTALGAMAGKRLGSQMETQFGSRAARLTGAAAMIPGILIYITSKGRDEKTEVQPSVLKRVGA